MTSDPKLTLSYWLALVAKRKRLVASIFVASVVIAAVASLLMPKVYRGETVCRIERGKDKDFRDKELISAKELVDMVGDVKSREKIALLFPKQSEFIRLVALSELKGSPDKFRVVVESERIDGIQDALAELTSYLNHNPLLERSVRQYRELLQKQVDELGIVIKQSTEMRLTLDKMLKDGRLLPVGFNPMDLSRRVADLHVEKLSLEQAMNSLSGVEAAERVFILKKPVRPRTISNVALAGVLGLVIGVGLAHVLESTDRSRHGRGG